MIKIQNNPPQQPGQWPAQPQYQQQPYQQQYPQQQPYPQQYPQQQQPMQPPMQQPGVPKKNNTMIIVAVVAVVAIVVVALLALVLMRGGAGMTIQITDWDTDQNTLSVLSGEVTFTVDLTNTGTATSTGVVTCKLVLSAGGTLQQTQSVTLAPGASTTITVVVPATSFLQYAFLSTGQATCTIA